MKPSEERNSASTEEDTQCIRYSASHDSINLERSKKAKFSPIEDDLLVSLVKELGNKNWNEISKRMGGRNSRQCRDRYNHYLSPENKFEEWTEEEDKLLLEVYEKSGPRWASLAAFFPGRPSVSVRNRCCRLLRLMENGKLEKLHSKTESRIPRSHSAAPIPLNPGRMEKDNFVFSKRVRLPDCAGLPFPFDREKYYMFLRDIDPLDSRTMLNV